VQVERVRQDVAEVRDQHHVHTAVEATRDHGANLVAPIRGQRNDERVDQLPVHDTGKIGDRT
jgi:hypothetical protein